jgi:putative flavoprotein involved in K+ transport
MTKPKSDRFVEEGAAFMNLAGLKLTARRNEHYDVVVIGGGQAGLSVGHYLAKRGVRFIILDASERIGDSWRKRWDSLKLFTPARFDALDGMPFPAPPDSFPTKDQMGDYLEAYAARFDLPVRSGMKVDELTKRDGLFVIRANGVEIEADQVVVAMSNYQKRVVPDFAAQLDPSIVQLHSSEYKSPAQLREGAVLIAGAGNSGAEIAVDLSTRHRLWLSGRNTGQIPFRPSGFWGRLLLVRLVLRVVFHRLLTVNTPMGRKARPKVLRGGGPLIRVKHQDLRALGVKHVPRIVGVRDGLPLLADDRTLDVSNVVWCTGFDPGFSWIKLPVFDEDGAPLHDSGVARHEPGLYFVGLHFLHAMSSVMIHGVGRDARRIVEMVAARRRSSAVEEPAPIMLQARTG